jgi:peptidoglycan-associated lipoprotein
LCQASGDDASVGAAAGYCPRTHGRQTGPATAGCRAGNGEGDGYREAHADAATGAANGSGGPTRPHHATGPQRVKDIFFDFDKYNIRPGDAKILDENATWLKANPGQLVLIEGHCDERGTVEYNLALGERRAKAAMNYLVAQGVQASRFTVISYGKERPFCRESNEACWSQNRRDHFLVKAQ